MGSSGSGVGCLAAVLLAGALVAVVVVTSTSGPAFPFAATPTPLPRLSGDATDAFSMPAQERVIVRRLTIDVPASALPMELGAPIPIHIEIDVDPSSARDLALAVVDGQGAEVVRQRRAAGEVDVRWELVCALAEDCRRAFDVAISREEDEAELDVSWRVKAQIRYPQGGFVPTDAALAVAIEPAPVRADTRQPLVTAVLGPEVISLSAAEPHVIRLARVELHGTDRLSPAAVSGLRGFVRTELVTTPEATPPPAPGAHNVPAREPPPIEVLVWASHAKAPNVMRTIVGPGDVETDQLDLGAECRTGADPCTADVLVTLRLLSDRTIGDYTVSLAMEAQLLADTRAADATPELAIARMPVPDLELVFEETARGDLTLTRENRFSAQGMLSALLSPALVTPDLPHLPVLSTAELRVSASVAGSTRRPPIQLVVESAYGRPSAIRDFLPGEDPTVRSAGFGHCEAGRHCHWSRAFNVMVREVADEMTSAETVTVTVEATVGVYGFASGEGRGGLLTVEVR